MSLKVDVNAILEIIEKLKGDISWREFCRRCNLNHSIIYRIKSGDYHPGLRTLMKFTMIVPREKRNELYNEFLKHVEWD